jgi:predicted transcriptional regulator
MLSLLSAIVSRNSLAIIALAGLIGWATIAVKKHDQKVARAAVAEHTEQARETVKKAKTAQRRVDPDSARRVLDSKYCTGSC